MRKKIPVYLFIFILLISNFKIALSGTTGKITGRVTSSETGDPIPGVSVVIQGTTLGAATNFEGYFVINNVPPGTYTVIISAIGFQKQQFNNVKVSTDFTTKLNAQLVPEAVAMGTVIVEAQAPLIRTDLTSSQTTVDAATIEALPIEGISQVLTLQAGIIQGSGGELHIRGGRSNEIAYSVNGVSISNPFDNTVTVEIAKNAIQELSVVSGTFNAEYGRALSGIVNTVTKEGSEKYRGQISVYSGDYVSSRTDPFFNIDVIKPFNSYVIEATFGGPVPYLDNKFSFFLSMRKDESRGWLYGKREHPITDSVWINPANPNDIKVAMNGDNQIVAMNPNKSFSGTAKLTFKPLAPLKINLDFLYSNAWWKSYSHDYKFNPDAMPNNYDWGLLGALDIRHSLSAKTFYSFKLAYNFHDYKSFLFPLLDSANNKPVDFYPGKSLDGLYADPRYQPDHKLVRPAPYTFSFGGTINSHNYERTKTVSAKFDMTSQVSMSHELKFGLETKIHNLAYESFSVKRDTIRYLKPTIPRLNTLEHERYSKFPLEISAYIQDKMEFESMVMNVGLRYDYFNSKSKYSTDIFYPTPNDPLIPDYIDKNSLLAVAEPKHQFSPRFGISFPITDKGIIHFSYGHFFQMPPFQYLYTNPEFMYDIAAGTQLFGDANLNPEKTVTYELGLQQQLFEDLAFTVTGFYKDVRDLLATQTIRVSGDKTYLKFVNKDYANIKGITFSLTKRKSKSDNLGVTVDYTFQVAEGNDVNSDAFFLDLSSGRQSEKIPIFLTWDQTHTLNTTVAFTIARDWNFSLIGRVGTGLPYTPQIYDKQIYIRTNSDRKPFFAIVDLLAEKTFEIFGYTVAFFLKVFNLFDILNERYVYNDTGRATYTLIQTSGGTKTTDELAATIPGIHSAAEYFNRPNYYYPPREVRFGFSIEF